MITKNEFIYAAITGNAIAGRDAGAENDGWRDRDSVTEAQGYYDAVTAGDLGEGIAEELEQATGEFDAKQCGKLLDHCREIDEAFDEVQAGRDDDFAALPDEMIE